MRLRGLLAKVGVRQVHPPPRLWDVLVGRRALGALSAHGANAAPLRVQVHVVRQGALPAEDIGAEVFCRQGTLANYLDPHPRWRSIGRMGTEGSEGATADEDIPESWAWMVVSDNNLCMAAAQAHLVHLVDFRH